MAKVERSRKTGGRTKGTPNKRTQDIQQRLEELGCDPIEGMALIAMNVTYEPELRGRMFAELAQYVAPKRKALEIAAEVNTTTSVQHMIASSDELVKKIRGEG